MARASSVAGRARGPGGLGHRRRLLEHARELLERGRGGLEDVVELAEVLHRIEEATQVEEERGEHADGDLPVEHAHRAVDEHDRRW